MSDSPTRIDLKDRTRNLRHRTIITKMCQYHKEVVRAGSANEPMIDVADFRRLKDYLDDVEALINSMNVAGAILRVNGDSSVRPEVDQPLTRDDFWDLASPNPVPLMENAFWEELAHRVSKAIREMKDSQSALFTNVWHPNDPPRWIAYLNAIRFDMDSIIGLVEPIDQPLTSPSQQPIFDLLGDELNTEGASNNPGHPSAS